MMLQSVIDYKKRRFIKNEMNRVRLNRALCMQNHPYLEMPSLPEVPALQKNARKTTPTAEML
jgi:hypothetical protein